jgi:HD-GYP domain-containing protein (c-di-GMP phosphodiesterase class II)
MNRDRLRNVAAELARLPALPTLSPEALQRAAQLIEQLIKEVKDLEPEYLPEVSTLRGIVRDLRRIGDPSAAESICAVVSEGFERMGRPTDAAAMLNIAGLTCSDQGVFAEGEQYFERALAILPPDDPLFQKGTILNNYGNLLTELERFDEAMALYELAMQVLEEAPRAHFLKARGTEPEHVTGTVTNNLGWTFLRQAKSMRKDPDLVEKAVAFLSNTLSSSLRPRTRIIAEGNLAEAYLMRGATEQAEEILTALNKECVDLRLERLLPEVYRREAQLHAYRGEIRMALDWSQKALETSLRLTNPRQELRVVEVFFDMLNDLLGADRDRLGALEGAASLVLNRLLDLLKSKDMYTGEDHSRRVSSLSRRLTVFMYDPADLDERWLKTVELGGLLHDVGKLMVPWSLLNQVRALSPREMKHLHQHASAGEKILSDLGLPELAVIAGEHHERLNGSGYPHSKKDLELDVSIVAVADVYEAMTSPSRRYREPKRANTAVSEIKMGSGVLYDRRVVDALEAVILREFKEPR